MIIASKFKVISTGPADEERHFAFEITLRDGPNLECQELLAVSGNGSLVGFLCLLRLARLEQRQGEKHKRVVVRGLLLQTALQVGW